MPEQANPTFLRDEPGRWVCHYTKRDTAFEHILPTGQLRLSSFRRMRDPIEASDWGLRYVHPSEGYPAEGEVDAASAETSALKGRAKLLALALDAGSQRAGFEEFASGLARPRMWEQYADDRTGVCLVFDRELLHAAVTAHAHTEGLPLYCGEVRYTPEGIAGEGQAMWLPLDETRRLGLAEALRAHADQHYKALFLTKLADWEAEREYRYVALTEQQDDFLFVPYRDALRAVFIGWRYPSSEEAVARAAADQLGLSLYRLVWINGRPRRSTVG